MAYKFIGGNRHGLTHASLGEANPYMTIATWFKLDALGHQYFLRKKTGQGGFIRYALFINYTTNVVRSHFNLSTGAAGALGTTVLTTGIWYHAAGVKDSVGARIYLNGGEEGFTANALGMNDGPDTFMMGGSDDDGGYMRGDLAEMGIWNAALTPGEILGLAKGVSPAIIHKKDQIAYWPLFGFSLPEADLSGNDKELTLYLGITGPAPSGFHAPVGRIAPASH